MDFQFVLLHLHVQLNVRNHLNDDEQHRNRYEFLHQTMFEHDEVEDDDIDMYFYLMGNNLLYYYVPIQFQMCLRIY